jgi:hypothetical protein
MHSDRIWTIIGFAVAAQASGLVGLVQLTDHSALQVVIGLVVAGIGAATPLTIRSMETSFRMDRLLLDRYESQLLSSVPSFKQEHGARLNERLSLWRGKVTDDQWRSLSKRRFSDRKYAQEINGVLDFIGQPSLIWTGITPILGAVAFDVSLTLGVGTTWYVVVAIIVSNLALLILMFLALIPGLGSNNRADRKSGMETHLG